MWSRGGERVIPSAPRSRLKRGCAPGSTQTSRRRLPRSKRVRGRTRMEQPAPRALRPPWATQPRRCRGLRAPPGHGAAGFPISARFGKSPSFRCYRAAPRRQRGGGLRGARFPSAERQGPGRGTRPPWQSRPGQEPGGPRPGTAASLGAWGEPRASRAGPL